MEPPNRRQEPRFNANGDSRHGSRPEDHHSDYSAPAQLAGPRGGNLTGKKYYLMTQLISS